MKEINHHKYSLFFLEKYLYDKERNDLHVIDSQPTFEYYETFDTLEKAQETQKHFEQKTIILPSY